MKTETITLAETLKEFGFVVYLAESQNYGIFTDNTGARVVYFQCDKIRGCQFFGTYKANRECGTGWKLKIASINRIDLKNALITPAPQWATGGYAVTYHTLDTYLKYNKHPKYYRF